VAGSFAATKEMARLLGEEEFSALFHQGSRDNIQLTLVGDRTLLTILFDDKTTVGMIRLYATETSRKLGEVFADASGRADNPEVAVDDTYHDRARSKLDDIFGSPRK